MAVTSTELEDLGAIGNNRGKRVSIVTTGNYATGGYAIAITGMSHVNLLIPEQAGGVLWRFDEPTQKLLAYHPTAAHTHTENTAGSYTQNATTSASAVAVATEYTNGAALAATVQAFVLGE